jgi:hypothetical protein
LAAAVEWTMFCCGRAMMGLPCGCDDGTRSCSPKHDAQASASAEASAPPAPAVEECRSQDGFADAWMAGGQALGWAQASTRNGGNGDARAEDMVGLAAAQRVAKKREAATWAPERGEAVEACWQAGGRWARATVAAVGVATHTLIFEGWGDEVAVPVGRVRQPRSEGDRSDEDTSRGRSGWARSGLTGAGAGDGRARGGVGSVGGGMGGGVGGGVGRGCGGGGIDGVWQRGAACGGAGRASGGRGRASGRGGRRGGRPSEQDEIALCRAVWDGTVGQDAAARAEAVAARQRAEDVAAREHAARQAAALRSERQARAGEWAARREAEAAAAATAQARQAEEARRAARLAQAAAEEEAAAATVAAARQRYAVRWSALLAWATADGPLPESRVGIGPAPPPADCLRFAAMPWPSEAWARARGDAGAADLDAAEVRSVVVPPEVTGTAARKTLQDELRRWHPDKFVARYGGALLPTEREEILEGVTRISQCLTELLQRESSG